MKCFSYVEIILYILLLIKAVNNQIIQFVESLKIWNLITNSACHNTPLALKKERKSSVTQKLLIVRYLLICCIIALDAWLIMFTIFMELQMSEEAQKHFILLHLLMIWNKLIFEYLKTRCCKYYTMYNHSL